MTEPRRSHDSDTSEDSESNLDEQREQLLQRVSNWLDTPMAILALIWTALLVFELAAGPPAGWTERIYQLDGLIWVLFLIHFLFEFAIAPRKITYLRTHWLTAVSVFLPFLRIVRLARAVRALRTLSLARIVLTTNRATRAAADILIEHRFGYVVTVVLIVVLLGAAGVAFFERDVPGAPLGDFGEALWWAAALITTVNVGSEPVTVEARIIALLIRVVGVALFGYVAGSIASYFVGQRERGREQSRRIELEELRRLVEELRLLRAELGSRPAEPERAAGDPSRLSRGVERQ